MLLIRGDIKKHFGKIEDALNDYSNITRWYRITK
jgi:hypothetical protein